DRDESDGFSEYYTSDGGKSWNSGGGGRRIQYLWLHDSTWLIGTYDARIVKSYDDFKSGKYIDSIFYLNQCNKLNTACIMAKLDSSNIIAIGRQYGGLFRSTDAGNSWYEQFCFPDPLVGFNLGIYGSVSLPSKL